MSDGSLGRQVVGLLMRSPTVRSLTWRLGRKLYRTARREGENDPSTNGEYWLLEKVLAADPTGTPVLLDIGANIGDWSDRAVSLLHRRGLRGTVYAFEPAAQTFAHLSNRFQHADMVRVNRLALSSRSVDVEFFVTAAHAGTNSLTNTIGATIERVPGRRLDDFLSDARLRHLLLVKSDTEGHDLSVLRGGSDTLRRGDVSVWQFEYNHRWIPSGAVLRDVFEFIADKPYTLGKLYGNGIELYEQWHPELERLFETNYVLVRHGSTVEGLCTRVRFDASNTPVPC